MSYSLDKNRPPLSAKKFHFGIVVSRYNSEITSLLLGGAQKILKGAQTVDLLEVPGCFEIPLALKSLAKQKRYDALIALGCVIRGETPHFDYVAGEAARGVMAVMLGDDIPIAFGILTTDNLEQAMARAGGRYGNKGEEAAWVAIEMAALKNGTQKKRT